MGVGGFGMTEVRMSGFIGSYHCSAKHDIMYTVYVYYSECANVLAYAGRPQVISGFYQILNITVLTLGRANSCACS